MDTSFIGQSVVITGTLRAEEDLTLEGRLDGTVDLGHNALTIGQHGTLKADARAGTVVVMGKVVGGTLSAATINIRETAIVEGDLVAPKIGIEEGASFKGTIDMSSSKSGGAAVAKKRPSQETTAPAQTAVA